LQPGAVSGSGVGKLVQDPEGTPMIFTRKPVQCIECYQRSTTFDAGLAVAFRAPDMREQQQRLDIAR
jgi:hypothetical protein